MSSQTIQINIKGTIKNYPKHLIFKLPLLKEYYENIIDKFNGDIYYINCNENLFLTLLDVIDGKASLDGLTFIELYNMYSMANEFMLRGDIYTKIYDSYYKKFTEKFHIICAFSCLLLFLMFTYYGILKKIHYNKKAKTELFNYLVDKQNNFTTSIMPYKLFDKATNLYLKKIEKKIENEKEYRSKLNYDITKLNSMIKNLNEQNEASDEMFNKLLQTESLYSKSLMMESLWYKHKANFKFLIKNKILDSKMIEFNKFNDILESKMIEYKKYNNVLEFTDPNLSEQKEILNNDNSNDGLIDHQKCYEDDIIVYLDAENSNKIFEYDRPLKISVSGEFCGVKINKILNYYIEF